MNSPLFCLRASRSSRRWAASRDRHATSAGAAAEGQGRQGGAGAELGLGVGLGAGLVAGLMAGLVAGLVHTLWVGQGPVHMHVVCTLQNPRDKPQ